MTRVLFATSNGTGLGHLNRAMAIARRLPEGFESTIFTLSQAAPVVARQGFDVDYLASYRRPGSGTDRAWNLRLRAKLEQSIDERRPDLVVFDGVHPYRALTHVLSARGAPASVWCRRPLWRQSTPAAALRRVGAFDAVLEPGELAASADRGPTVPLRGTARRVDPIVYVDPEELLDRETAAAELGLDPGRRTVLVALGQGGDLGRATFNALSALSLEPDLQVAVLRSSLAGYLEAPANVVPLNAPFPISRCFRAFDVAIAAAGYNGFHELIAFGVPSLFVPMSRTTDDQFARATWAAERGVGLAAAGASDPGLRGQVRRLVDPEVAEGLRRRCGEAFTANGAADAAEFIAGMARGRAAAPRVRDRGRLNRWLRLSSHPLGPTLPLVLGIGARDLARHPERRAPRLLVLALGVPGHELGDRVRAAIGGEDPGRVLVITDSLRFAALRELGVGFELVRPGSAGGRLTPAREEAMTDRIELLLAGRKPLRAVSIGAHGAELIGGGGVPRRDREVVG